MCALSSRSLERVYGTRVGGVPMADLAGVQVFRSSVSVLRHTPDFRRNKGTGSTVADRVRGTHARQEVRAVSERSEAGS